MKDEPNAGADALELRIDSKTYLSADGNPVEVIRGLTLRLEAGTFGALMGPSGCGKTTLLRIAAGLDSDFVGTRRVPPSHRLGIVFQEPRLLPWRTVEENINLVLPEGKTATDLGPLVETLGLAAHMAHYPGELSLGLARRVAIARAFAVRPTLLLLDEPFVSLDETTAARLREELTALTRREKITTLCVTHGLAEAIELADHLFFLSHRPAAVVFARQLHRRELPRSKADIASIQHEVRDALARLDGATASSPEGR
ncbi:ATP-binding cassette domain-containing protein [Bradyrhizobium sp.]|uniref:ABC transporter ATP-binding protein n=1 Tax=Bradyrhizobium sp. TaxID=376 RepID=UPI00262A0249|nr:ATP-binding cassette domain-containing protein [Bradyrhizobium sp.]